MWKWLKGKSVWIVFAVIGVLIFFKDVLFDLILGSSRRVTEETKKKAAKHRLKAERAKARAEAKMERVKEIEKEIEKIDAGEDWHKKRED